MNRLSPADSGTMKAVSKKDGYYRTLGNWGIIVIGHWQTKYWFYPDGGRAGTYPSRLDAGLEYCGYIDTWSRDYHLFFTHKFFDEVAGQLGSGNIWEFSGGHNEEYGDTISGMWPSPPESDGGVDENGVYWGRTRRNNRITEYNGVFMETYICCGWCCNSLLFGALELETS